MKTPALSAVLLLTAVVSTSVSAGGSYNVADNNDRFTHSGGSGLQGLNIQQSGFTKVSHSTNEKTITTENESSKGKMKNQRGDTETTQETSRKGKKTERNKETEVKQGGGGRRKNGDDNGGRKRDKGHTETVIKKVREGGRRTDKDRSGSKGGSSEGQMNRRNGGRKADKGNAETVVERVRSGGRSRNRNRNEWRTFTCRRGQRELVFEDLTENEKLEYEMTSSAESFSFSFCRNKNGKNCLEIVLSSSGESTMKFNGEDLCLPIGSFYEKGKRFSFTIIYTRYCLVVRNILSGVELAASVEGDELSGFNYCYATSNGGKGDSSLQIKELEFSETEISTFIGRYRVKGRGGGRGQVEVGNADVSNGRGYGRRGKKGGKGSDESSESNENGGKGGGQVEVGNAEVAYGRQRGGGGKKGKGSSESSESNENGGKRGGQVEVGNAEVAYGRQRGGGGKKGKGSSESSESNENGGKRGGQVEVGNAEVAYGRQRGGGGKKGKGSSESSESNENGGKRGGQVEVGNAEVAYGRQRGGGGKKGKETHSKFDLKLVNVFIIYLDSSGSSESKEKRGKGGGQVEVGNAEVAYGRQRGGRGKKGKGSSESSSKSSEKSGRRGWRTFQCRRGEREQVLRGLSENGDLEFEFGSTDSESIRIEFTRSKNSFDDSIVIVLSSSGESSIRLGGQDLCEPMLGSFYTLGSDFSFSIKYASGRLVIRNDDIEGAEMVAVIDEDVLVGYRFCYATVNGGSDVTTSLKVKQIEFSSDFLSKFVSRYGSRVRERVRGNLGRNVGDAEVETKRTRGRIRGKGNSEGSSGSSSESKDRSRKRGNRNRNGGDSEVENDSDGGRRRGNGRSRESRRKEVGYTEIASRRNRYKDRRQWGSRRGGSWRSRMGKFYRWRTLSGKERAHALHLDEQQLAMSMYVRTRAARFDLEFCMAPNGKDCLTAYISTQDDSRAYIDYKGTKVAESTKGAFIRLTRRTKLNVLISSHRLSIVNDRGDRLSVELPEGSSVEDIYMSTLDGKWTKVKIRLRRMGRKLTSSGGPLTRSTAFEDIGSKRTSLSCRIRTVATFVRFYFCFDRKDCYIADLSTESTEASRITYQGDLVSDEVPGNFIIPNKDKEFEIFFDVNGGYLKIWNTNPDSERQLIADIPKGRRFESVSASTDDGDFTELQMIEIEASREISSETSLERTTVAEQLNFPATLQFSFNLEADLLYLIFSRSDGSSYTIKMSTKPTDSSVIITGSDEILAKSPSEPFLLWGNDIPIQNNLVVTVEKTNVVVSNMATDLTMTADISEAHLYNHIDIRTEGGGIQDFSEEEVEEPPATESPAEETEASPKVAPDEENEAPATEAPESEAPATEPPAEETEAPATEPPPAQTEAPETEPPPAQTEAPATEPPSEETEAPETEPPPAQTEAPATEPPPAETEAPATEPPPAQTDAPATEPPPAETEAPATEPPPAETEAPATEPPPAETEAPATEPPPAETDAPATEPPPAETEAPATEPPPAETDAPATEPPPAETDAPATEPPPAQTEAPATEPPAEETEAPATEPPSAETDAPATEPPPAQTEAPATEPPAEETEAPATEPPSAETDAPATEPQPAETEAPATEPPPAETDAPATEPPPAETEAPATEPPPAETDAPATEPPPAETEAPATEPPPEETEAPAPDEGTRGDSPVVELPRNRGNRIIQEGNDQSTQGSSLKPSQVPPVIETIRNTGSTDESEVKETVVPEVVEPAVKPFNEEPDESGILQTQPSGDAQFFDQSLDFDRLLQLQFDFSVTIPKGFSILLTQAQFLQGDYYSIGITEGNEFMVMRCNTESNQCDSLYAGPIEQIGEVVGTYIFTLKIQKTFDDKDDHDGTYSYKFTLLYDGAVVGQEVVVGYPDTFYIKYIGCTSEGYLATWKIFSIVSPGTTQRSSSIILRDIDDSCSLEVDVFDRELVFSVEAEELLYIHLYTSNGMYIIRVGDNGNEYVTGSLGEATSPGDASRLVQEGVLSLSGKQYYLSWRNSRIKFGETAEDSEAMLDWFIGEEISVSKLEFVAKVDSVYLIHTYKYFYLYANVLQWTHDRIRATSLTFFSLRYERGAPFIDLKIKASGTVLIALATDQAHPESSMSLIHMSSRKISLSECLGCEAITSVTIREDQPALLDPSLFLEYQIIYEDGILKIFSTTQETALFTYDGIQQGTLYFYDGFGGTIGSYYHIRLNQGTIYQAEHCHDINTYLDGGMKLLNIQHSDQMIAFFDEEVNLEAELAMEDTQTELRTSRGGIAIDTTTIPSCIYHDPSTLVWLAFTDGAIQYGTYNKENHQRSDPCMTFNLREGHKVKYISFGRQRPEWSVRHHSIERKVVYKQLITRVKSSVLVKGPPIRVKGPPIRVNGPPVRVNGL
ncbi:uncharacterized protein LOC121431742 [Lytechinus variegatus]|uniref:uncharacterized protein LOC121431742 n=1 Tax=Lytechinus variegatus TaxID=7654 RepID=UPI001BB2250E|nr:uncharacterized protein LOC121431742 [Lytechinus variegatus]